VRWIPRVAAALALGAALVACAAISGLDLYSTESDCPADCDASVDARASTDARMRDGRAPGDATGEAETEAVTAPDASSEDAPTGAWCAAGLAPCDGGCVSLSSVDSCGGCGMACPSPTSNGAATCTNGTCGVACDPGYSLCDGTCVQYSTPTNCGSCGNVCDFDAGTPLCAATADGVYSCVPACPAATPTRCGETCVDTTSDPNNCAECGNPCTSGVTHSQPVCVHGACTYACDSAYEACNGACVQYTTAANCGRCGNTCGGDAGSAVCAGTGGWYACVSGCPSAAATLCTGSCVDIASDPDNCNGCGLACETSVANSVPACQAGACTFTCAAGTGLCNGACIQYTTSANCGSCGAACASDGGTPVCAAAGDGGAYACASGCPAGASTRCEGACVDTSSDASNCGTCGHACSTGVANAQPACVNGACSFTCGAGYSLCNSACADFASDPNNCGGCGSAHACGGGMTCHEGQCTMSCTETSECPPGYACNGSTCTTSCSALQTCNGGCCAGGICVVGTAAAACGTNGGACTDCASGSTNLACVGGLCGCNAGTDCASLTACSLTIHSCQTLCGGANTACNGGCCTNLSLGGQCVQGNVDTQCGSTGGQCEDCQTACGPGPHCLNDTCGCTTSLDCLAFSSCAPRTDCSAGACQ